MIENVLEYIYTLRYHQFEDVPYAATHLDMYTRADLYDMPYLRKSSLNSLAESLDLTDRRSSSSLEVIMPLVERILEVVPESNTDFHDLFLRYLEDQYVDVIKDAHFPAIVGAYPDVAVHLMKASIGKGDMGQTCPKCVMTNARGVSKTTTMKCCRCHRDFLARATGPGQVGSGEEFSEYRTVIAPRDHPMSLGL